MPANDPLTIGDLMLALGVDPTPEWLDWPPDVFAVVATILKKTGTYTALVERWPMEGAGMVSADEWLDVIVAEGAAWRKSCERRLPAPAPARVAGWWKTVLDNRAASAMDIKSQPALTAALLQLCASADEACRDIGIPSGAGSTGSDRFDLSASVQLNLEGTMARRVSAARVRILPKLHTPRSGMTLRSLTHNLALCPSEDVFTNWKIVSGGPEEGRGLNLLILPWPRRVMPRQFVPAASPLDTMPGNFGFFRYESDVDADTVTRDAVAAIEEAERIVGTVHGVVLPELALTADAYRKLRDEVTVRRRAFLVCGIGEPASADEGTVFDRNYLTFDVHTQWGAATIAQQDKHHRWKLSRSQILQVPAAAQT